MNLALVENSMGLMLLISISLGAKVVQDFTSAIPRHLPHYPMCSTFSTNTTSNFQAIFNAALTKYIKETGSDLRNHSLASKIDCCDSPDSILNVFREQAQAFEEFRKGDTKLFKWIRPVVEVLYTLSSNEAIGDTASLVSPMTAVLYFLDILYPRYFRPQKQSSAVLGFFYPYVTSSLSPSHSLSHLALPDGQIRESELRCLGRHLRMHRELPRTT